MASPTSDADGELEQRATSGRGVAVAGDARARLAATASVKATTGVTMPSLSPLSTLSTRRSRMGMRSVVDHLGAEGGVGGRQRRSDETGQRPGQVVEDPRRSEGPEQDREWEADPEQPCWEGMVMPELGDVHPRRIGEQQERECHLRDQMDRGSVDIRPSSGPQSGFASR